MNAKDELAQSLIDLGYTLNDIEALYIRPYGTRCLLLPNYTPEDLTQTLPRLDFDYDNGYGGQELFGTVWLKDGTWLERGEYDGSEWWEHRKRPALPTAEST